jgi:hypothetical protein
LSLLKIIDFPSNSKACVVLQDTHCRPFLPREPSIYAFLHDGAHIAITACQISLRTTQFHQLFAKMAVYSMRASVRYAKRLLVKFVLATLNECVLLIFTEVGDKRVK